MCSCNFGNTSKNSIVLTVDQLRSNREYASQIVDVWGEVIEDYHGTTLCNPKGDSGFFIVLPGSEEDFKLEEDYLYEKYKNLSIEIGLVQKKLGNARLFATLRGQLEYYTYSDDGEEIIVINPNKSPFDDIDDEDFSPRVRFLLQKVLELDIRGGSGKPSLWLSDDPADIEELLREIDKDK